jgi:hypothetical protein
MSDSHYYTNDEGMDSIEEVSPDDEAIARAVEASMDDMREAQALARAMEASLHEQLASESERLARELHRSETEAADLEASLHEQLASESERLAQELHHSETEAADQELAQALDFSHQEHISDSLADAMSQAKRQRTEERNEGSWDCPKCTFTNVPYLKKCHGCETSAPAHVLVFSKMPMIRFGLEIEMFIPQGRQDGFTYESIAENLTTIGPPSVEFRGYSHETSECWKIVTDSSIGADHDDLCFELVSPILQGEDGLASLRSVMDNVRRLGIATNSSCGFHVHVDAESSSSPDIGALVSLQRISQYFCSMENAFDLLVDLTWTTVDNRRRANQNEYCRSNLLAFGQQSNRQRWKRISSTRSKQELINIVNPGNDRYRKLNLTNICNPSRPSTCEFRHHGGVEDLREAEAWVRLIVVFCRNAAQSTTSLMLPEGAPPESELRALFDLVDEEGLEQFFVVERRLFCNHRLYNEWKCRVCHRKFGSTRSLSQHAAACGH